MKYFDSHCHLNSPELRPTISEEIFRAHEAGVSRMVVVGCTLADSEEAVEICRAGEGLYPTVGVHPHEVKDLPTDQSGEFGLPPRLIELASLPEVLAWGEIGLDYYYELSPRDLQIEMLVRQLEAAKSLKKRVVFHMRGHAFDSSDAYADFWSLMTSERAPENAELHCFTGTLDDAKKALDRGWKFGISGMITFATTDELRAVVKDLPLDSLLCETDSPWLAPKPFRGKTNEPSYVPLVYKKLAELKDIPLEELCERIWQNNLDFWGIE